MLRDEKWLGYAIKILKVAHQGASSMSAMADEVGGARSYVTKVVTSLRKGGLIDDHYQLSRHPESITVREVMAVASTYHPEPGPSGKILQIMLNALEIPITQVW